MRHHKILTYILAALIVSLTACSSDEPTQRDPGLSGMNFRAVTCPISRSGVYDGATSYPTNKPLTLTAYYKDPDLDTGTQYYFRQQELTDMGSGLWTLPDWYWPLQGKMSFLGMWFEKSTMIPTFDEIENSDGTKSARMIINTATRLDAKMDLLYLAQDYVDCPQRGTMNLVFRHALAWITVSVRALVLDDSGTTPDISKTQHLINNIKLHKVVIENCARNGIASVVPGSIISWSIPEAKIRNQVYYFIGGNPDSQTWIDTKNEENLNITRDIPLSMTPLELGKYNPSFTSGYDPTTGYFIGKGLLIVPQNKTAIRVDYTLTNDQGDEIHRVERFVLSDNDLTWEPGYHYDYDIVFSNYSEIGDNITLISSWEGITYDGNNLALGSGAIGNLYFTYDSSGSTHSVSVPPVVIEAFHDGGSALGDEMDYRDGGTVF